MQSLSLWRDNYFFAYRPSNCLYVSRHTYSQGQTFSYTIKGFFDRSAYVFISLIKLLVDLYKQTLQDKKDVWTTFVKQFVIKVFFDKRNIDSVSLFSLSISYIKLHRPWHHSVLSHSPVHVYIRQYTSNQLWHTSILICTPFCTHTGLAHGRTSSHQAVSSSMAAIHLLLMSTPILVDLGVGDL